MRRYNQTESWEKYLEELDGYVMKGYYVSGDSPNNLKLIPNSKLEYLPEIELKPELDSDGETDMIYFMPVITFPVLDTTKLDFADSVYYYLDKWHDIVGYIAKKLVTCPYKIEYDEIEYDEIEYDEI